MKAGKWGEKNEINGYYYFTELSSQVKNGAKCIIFIDSGSEAETDFGQCVI